MFAEDIGLLPQDLFTRFLDECRRGASSYDPVGGLFATVDPIELTPPELGPPLGRRQREQLELRPARHLRHREAR